VWVARGAAVIVPLPDVSLRTGVGAANTGERLVPVFCCSEVFLSDLQGRKRSSLSSLCVSAQQGRSQPPCTAQHRADG
jgi:hypothetical protein